MSLRIGLMTFVTDQSMSVVDLAREAETRGFESLFVPEKTHLPVSRRTAWPGGDLPETYKRTFDPFVALSAAAAVTDTIRLGTGICMAVARDPIVTAKEVASIDVLSQGRFIFGVGYGWNAEEIEDHGVPFDERAAVLRDKVLAMKAIWSADEAGYEGDHVSFEPTWSWPKPLQHPHPPIVMGSRASAANFGDIAEYCDGWMPIEYFGKTVELVPRLRLTSRARLAADGVLGTARRIQWVNRGWRDTCGHGPSPPPTLRDSEQCYGFVASAIRS